ncbi:head-to-tail stopper [Mycobacterium phage QueenHazel]|uniref:Head-to-tail stopper n=1 Tax=Mycobacterium phage Xula TaxID=2599884 RepID=A0A5J6TQS5_9CAUD|nr:head closure [Mycobacterium phage Xula]QFG11082.1 head-to-tail stopper [Mycobacterium phage Xula]QFG15018.1 head-to-tail stopper [Mycobacterium phage QueenHazel]
MSEQFGGQVVAIVTVAPTGSPGWGGLKSKSRTAVRVPGCHFRPAGSSETPDAQTNVATEFWKLTAPPVAAVLAAKASGELLYDGSEHPELLNPESSAGRAATFQIEGPIMPKYDDGSEVHHVTIMCKRQIG